MDGILTTNSILRVIYQGDVWSNVVLAILLLMSIFSWSIILRKWISIASASKASKRFTKGIKKEDEIEDIYLRAKSFPQAYLAVMIQYAYQGLHRLRSKRSAVSGQQVENSIDRIIEKSILTSKVNLDKGLNWLATISASAPFIGLLGTVLGIIDSFYSIAEKGASSIAVVAPGLSAALVATAVGLFTAIPALIAYNIFKNRSKEISEEMVSFGLDLFPQMLASLSVRK